MTWHIVKLVLHREVRDQLRDRRTLFMIAVLPLLLYPLLGMSMFQVLQFISEHATRVQVIGAEQLPPTPQLIDKGCFSASLFSDPSKAKLLEVTPAKPNFEAKQPPLDAKQTRAEIAALARRWVEQGECEAVIYFPPDFAQRLKAFRESLARREVEPSEAQELAVPSPEVFFNTAKEKSQITHTRVSLVLDRWREEIGRQNLDASHLPESAAKPFEVAEHDVAAEGGHRDAAVWSKLLPFLLLIWALTGAFYPAIDLCAGEKERGTLETLLSSPAERSEIVWGKLLTVMSFSMASAVLNLVSMGVTGKFVVGMLAKQVGPPPPLTPLWLLIALVPMSALFSALCLALAAFARSSKEGQYYLMPLMLVTMPLVILPMAPGVELTLGNSLIPVTGVVLLLRAMLEGNYWHALPFIAPVAAVTLGCCLWAIRWAIDQFNSESVLFRESERLDMGLWLRHLLRDRADTPSPAMALFCGVLILLVQFFMNFALHQSMPEVKSFHDLLTLVMVSQLVVILTPALLMTVMLTRSPRQTLLLRKPPFAALSAAVLLALCLHPVAARFAELVQYLYPVNKELTERVGEMMSQAPSVWALLMLMAVTPAICEELAFRGFILSGLRHIGHKWWAIAISSLFFGILHGILQQSIITATVGLVIGFLAVQTGSLFPCMLFHLTHNSLTVLAASFNPKDLGGNPFPEWFAQTSAEGGYAFGWPTVAVGAALSAALLTWFHSLPYSRTAEETLQDALEHQSAPAAAS
ncbi:MAG TPA: ABC transporter permease subunit/CPBP intramembrane protease [Pirellulales bacterium]|nr:ABC transporter permease subunit/CPBP intramembrane protease [Pirellulales bacterium]